MGETDWSEYGQIFNSDSDLKTCSYKVRNLSYSELDRLSYIENWKLPTEESVEDLLSGDLFKESALDFIRFRLQKQDKDDHSSSEDLHAKSYLKSLTSKAELDSRDIRERELSLIQIKNRLNAEARADSGLVTSVLNDLVEKTLNSFAGTLLDLGMPESEVSFLLKNLLDKMHSDINALEKNNSEIFGESRIKFNANAMKDLKIENEKVKFQSDTGRPFQYLPRPLTT